MNFSNDILLILLLSILSSPVGEDGEVDFASNTNFLLLLLLVLNSSRATEQLLGGSNGCNSCNSCSSCSSCSNRTMLI